MYRTKKGLEFEPLESQRYVRQLLEHITLCERDQQYNFLRVRQTTNVVNANVQVSEHKVDFYGGFIGMKTIKLFTER